MISTLDLAQDPVPERRLSPGQLDLQVTRQIQQALSHPAGLPQQRGQLGHGELIPPGRHLSRGLPGHRPAPAAAG